MADISQRELDAATLSRRKLESEVGKAFGVNIAIYTMDRLMKSFGYPWNERGYGYKESEIDPRWIY